MACTDPSLDFEVVHLAYWGTAADQRATSKISLEYTPADDQTHLDGRRARSWAAGGRLASVDLGSQAH